MNNERKLCKIFCLTGILAVVFYLLHDIVGAMNYPGYKWMSQAVSDLTSTTAPSYTVASGLSSVYGIMSVVCCYFACAVLQNKNFKLKLGVYLFATMNTISAIGYSLFPLSQAGYDGSIQSFIHVYIVTTLVVLLSIVSLIIIAIGAFKDNSKKLGILALVALGLMFIGAVGSNAVPKAYFGIIERFSTYSAVLFTCVLGIYSFKFSDTE